MTLRSNASAQVTDDLVIGRKVTAANSPLLRITGNALMGLVHYGFRRGPGSARV
ncbi:MAG: hypothetical protein ACLFVU_04640 [Phycisphaerae bacterium]